MQQVEQTKPTSWRDVLKIHPAADLFPLLGSDELKALGEDIKANGLKSPIVVWCKGECPTTRRGRQEPRKTTAEDIFLLDGRNRLDAMETVGLRVEVSGNGFTIDVWKTVVCEEDEDPQGFPASESAEEYIPLKKGDEYEDEAFDVTPTILFEKEDGKVVCDPYALADSLNLHRRHLTAEQRRERIEKALRANPERSDRSIAKEVGQDHKTIAAKREGMEARGEIPHVEKRTDTKGRQQPATKPPTTKLQQPAAPDPEPPRPPVNEPKVAATIRNPASLAELTPMFLEQLAEFEKWYRSLTALQQSNVTDIIDSLDECETYQREILTKSEEMENRQTIVAVYDAIEDLSSTELRYVQDVVCPIYLKDE
jgi:hypothetical protein